MNMVNINNNIDAFFVQTKELLQHDFDELFEGQSSYRSVPKLSRLPLTELVKVFNKLNVTLDAVIESRVDYSVMASQYADEDLMPTKYMESATLSSRFTGMYMINYISNTQGEKAARNLMQNFQLKSSLFLDSSKKNNVMLATDLCEHIFKYYGSEEVFQMGQHSVLFLKNSVHGQALSKSANFLIMFEHFCEEIAPKYVEKNYNWRIESIGSDYIIVSGNPTEELKDSFHSELTRAPSLEYLHLGILKSLPDFIGNFHTKVEALKSIQRGDSCNLFKLTYNPIQ